jgi:hypothetical protein
MLFIFKSFVYFTLSFIILCIPIRKDPAFIHLYKLTAPYTQQLFKSVKDETLKSIKESKKIGKQALLNITPKKHQDSISNTNSGTRKLSKKEQETMDSYTEEEKELLRKILKNQE